MRRKKRNNSMAMWLICVALFVVFIMLQVVLWGEGGLWSLWELRGSNETARAVNAELEEQNEMLAREVDDLKQGGEALEEKAREDLGMVRQGERFYRVIKQKTQEEVQE